MNLPHREPLIFAKDILSKNADSVKVKCEFAIVPTLAMFVEAAAQSSAAFNSNGDTSAKIGFLTITNNVKLLEEVETLYFVFVIKKEVEVGQYKKFFFDAHDKKTNVKIASGEFTLFIQE